MKWNIQNPTIPKDDKALRKILLDNRGVKDEHTFFHPIHPLELDPEAIGLSSSVLTEAATRIAEACKKQEPIIIFGDYDCDGVCATAVLWETLFEMECKVLPFIPHREKHGYGLSTKALDEILSNGKPAILISVDNGIVAHAQWKRLKDAGVFTILTDHHQIDKTPPPADVVIHTPKLCGTTVAWMLAREINKDKAAKLLDLCAIATIADQVPLLDANRSFAYFGLQELNHTKRVGLLLLMESAGVMLGMIDASTVHYAIAPRINAMGRLEHALDALRALCSKKREQSSKLIEKLGSVNTTRQELTVTHIQKALEYSKEWEDENIIIVSNESFHEGVIGLIASKLAETFYKPTVVLSKGKLTSKASCRSVVGVNITDFLRQVSSDLLELGGHPMAAGFKVETEKLALVSEKLRLLAKTTIDKKLLQPQLSIDCVLPHELLLLSVAQDLQDLAPFGSQNPEPLFAIHDLQVVKKSVVGKEGKHLKLLVKTLESTNLETIEVIGFGKGKWLEKITPQATLSIAGHVQIHEWKSRKNLQFLMRDFQ